MPLMERIVRAYQGENDPSKNPLNPVGVWIEKYRQERGMRLTDVAKAVDLTGLGRIRRAQTTNISLYTMEKLLQGTEILECSDEEKAGLADVICEVIATTLEEKGKLYERIPPIIPAKISKDLLCTTFTDTTFAKNLLGKDYSIEELHKLSDRISDHRNTLGFSAVFTAEQAEEIKKHIDNYDNNLRKNKVRKKDFAMNASGILEIDPTKFSTCTWVFTKKEIPSPAEFGVILEKIPMTAEKKEKIVQLWLDKFKNSIILKTLGNEYGISRERVRQIKEKLGVDEGTMTWETVEKIRQYLDAQREVKLQKSENIDFKTA